MYEMIAPDGHGIAVAHGDDNSQFGVAEFYARRKGKCPSVNGMKGMKIKVPGYA